MENEEFIDIRTLSNEQLESHIEKLKTQLKINKNATRNLIKMKKPEDAILFEIKNLGLREAITMLEQELKNREE